MSGAGKSTVLKFLEDIGFYCADNIPPSMIARLAAEIYANNNAEGDEQLARLAIGVDIRGGRLFEGFFEGYREIEKAGFTAKILFLDSSDEVLIKRFKESRRSHPLAMHENIAIGIDRERQRLENVRTHSDYIIDTSNVLTRELRTKIREIFLEDKAFDSLIVSIISFGYKYGIPSDSDLVFDVRFIPNPFYDHALRPLTGNDTPVYEFVHTRAETKTFLRELSSMLAFLIPCYKQEGKNHLVISIGCTGGKHRSVAIAASIFNELQQKGNSVIINHRDIEKDKPEARV